MSVPRLALKLSLACTFAAALVACAHSPSASDLSASDLSAPEPVPMTTSSADAYSPKLDAEQSLRRLLALIRGSRTIADINAGTLRQVFGVAFTEASGRLGFAERLDRDWWSSFESVPGSASGPHFEFSFRPDQPNANPAASAICKLDYTTFAAELEGMGFRHETYRGEHGRILHEEFQRDGMIVQVHTRGEAEAQPDKVAHACVQMVLIR